MFWWYYPFSFCLVILFRKIWLIFNVPIRQERLPKLTKVMSIGSTRKLRAWSSNKWEYYLKYVLSLFQLVTPAMYEKHQQKSLKEAQISAKNSFHCKTPDCKGWCFITDNLNEFKCPICKRLNCITCQVRMIFFFLRKKKERITQIVKIPMTLKVLYL